METIFDMDDTVVFILLVIATIGLNIESINSYLYALFLLVGITLGVIKIVKSLKSKK